MSTKTFLFFHGLVATLMLLTPNYLFFLTSKDLGVDITQLFGLSAIVVSLVVSIELFLGFVSSFLSLFIRRLLQMFWGFLLSPFGIFLLLESRLQQNKSWHVDFEVVKSVFLNLSNFWPVITKKIDLSTWLIMYELILLGVLMAIYGWQSVSKPLNKG